MTLLTNQIQKGWSVTPRMVPRSPQTVRSRMIGSPRLNIAAIPAPPPPAADGPTLGMVFSKSVKADKWTRKDEAVYAVSLRLGFQGKLNIGI